MSTQDSQTGKEALLESPPLSEEDDPFEEPPPPPPPHAQSMRLSRAIKSHFSVWGIYPLRIIYSEVIEIILSYM
jgi:hypothetical protein